MVDPVDSRNNEGTGGEGIPTADHSGAAVGSGTQIGPYKLLRILGEGGYGIVYLAERQRPVKRRVALKVIKPGMDTKQVIARFEAERQALALLDHPNIARVFNAGTTEAGRPYFAMEYVKGVPITEHCDRYKLTIEERLKLFLAVCEAVQHAHQKAIIHRDIKPSNILVAYEAEQAVPMIIDFGVAKALSQSLTERTLVTEQAQMIGTPEYMSPEQAEMTSQDIDTRTDIYSLGVLLYELLTGTLPFDPKTLREGGPERMRRMIREQDPQTPSARLSAVERDESLSLAEHRRTDIRTLGHRLHGELDWITLKAMDKDRTRRYQTAHALAEDIERYLKQEPVLACPPSTAYKVQKFIKRNKSLFISSAAIAAILILAVIVSTQQAWVARKARKAETVERKAAQTERDRAQEAEQKAQENLYDALVREARATRIARRTGYREEVFKALEQARDLDVPQRDLTKLRVEAIACLGDFIGLKPRQIIELPEDSESPEIWWATLHPTDPIAAFALSDGTVLLKDLHSTKDIARFSSKYSPRGLCFASTGNTLLSLHVPNAFTPEVRPTEAVARLFVRAQDGTWIQGKTIKVPGARQCISTANGFYISVVDESSHSVDIIEVINHSVVYHFDYPKDMNDPPMISLTSDGRLLATAITKSSNPNTSVVDIWDIILGKHLIHLEPGLAVCSCMRFSMDGHYLAYLSSSGCIVYSTETYEPVGRLTDQFDRHEDAVLLPGSTILVFEAGSKVFLWDYEKKQYVAFFEQASKDDPWFSTSVDGKLLMTYSSKQVWLYSLDVGNERLVLAGHAANATGVDFSPDGSHLASVSKDRTVRVWNSTTGHLEWEQLLDGLGQYVEYSADGKWLVTTDYENERVSIWSTKASERLLQLGSGRSATTWSAQFTDDNRYLITATARWDESDPGSLTIWECEINESESAEYRRGAKQIKSFTGRIIDLAIAPDNRHVAFVNSKGWRASQELYQWDITDTDAPSLVTDNIRGNAAQIIAFTPDSRGVISVDENHHVVTYDVLTGQKVASFPTLPADLKGEISSTTKISISPEGTTLALSTPSRLGVDLRDRESGRLLYTLPAERTSVVWLDWSPDGQRLAISRSDGAIDIWNLTEIERVLADLGLAP